LTPLVEGVDAMSATEGTALAVRRPAATQAGIRVCIVSFEVNGPTRNGGIGTAYTTLAENLAAAGHDVTLLYARGRCCEQGLIGRWVDHFQRRGVRLVPLPGGEAVFTGPGLQHLSYLVHQWLTRQGDVFDLVHFHEWLGLGYFSLLARRHGLGLTRTRCCVGLHSPSLWIQEANQTAVGAAVQEADAVERCCAELADVVWSPSRYLLAWAVDRGWRLAPDVLVHPNPLPFRPARSAQAATPIRELVFFGRLEVRKGLFVFCDALDRLQANDLPAGFSVTFLGRPTDLADTRTDVVVKKRAKKWPFPVRLRTSCDHAEGLSYLRGSGRLAVMPSLTENCPLTVIECLGMGVPFLAGAVGGIPELLAKECRATHLFEPRPDVLAQRLREALRAGVEPAGPAHDAEEVNSTWEEWHRQLPDDGEPMTGTPVESGDALRRFMQGQALCIEWLQGQLRAYSGGEEKFLRYRLADGLCAWVGKVPLLRPLLRLILRLLYRGEGQT
jgi:glycosyltransferase involved in cell wall biosynthesis